MRINGAVCFRDFARRHFWWCQHLTQQIISKRQACAKRMKPAVRCVQGQRVRKKKQWFEGALRRKFGEQARLLSCLRQTCSFRRPCEETGEPLPRAHRKSVSTSAHYRSVKTGKCFLYYNRTSVPPWFPASTCGCTAGSHWRLGSSHYVNFRSRICPCDAVAGMLDYLSGASRREFTFYVLEIKISRNI